jgi:hypothetical protein
MDQFGGSSGCILALVLALTQVLAEVTLLLRT